MEGKKKVFLKGVLAAAMMLCGMLLVYEPVTENEQSAVQVTAQPADERKEEKSSTTSQLYAQSAVLMDADSGRILLGKNEDQVLPMASTTKIMTCILVLEMGNSEDIIPVSSYAAGQPKVHLGARKGEYYKTKDLLYSLMLESHNDSAVILAEYYGSKWAGLSLDCASHSQQESHKAVTAFCEKMNEKARSLGCENTFFVTPNGLDGILTIEEDEERYEKKHETTAADMAAIMKYCAWDSPAAVRFLEITRTNAYSFQNYVKTEGGTEFAGGNRTVSCNNHNAFLQMMDGALTGKTGYTGKAGYCYVGALEREGKKFTIALLACGWPSNKTWKWHDSRLLFEYGLQNYEWKDIYIEETLENINVENGQNQQIGLTVLKEEINVLLGAEDSVEVEMDLPVSVDAPVKKGQQVGKQRYYVNGELFCALPIISADEVLRIDYIFCLKKVMKMAFL